MQLVEPVTGLAGLALSSLPWAVVITDAAGIVIWANANACAITGYSPDELIGRNASALVFESASSTIRHKNGSPVAVERTVAPIVDAGETWSVWTLRKLREQPYERPYRALYDSMYEGVAIHKLVRVDGVPVNYMLLDVNRRFEEIVGVKREDV